MPSLFSWRMDLYCLIVTGAQAISTVVRTSKKCWVFMVRDAFKLSMAISLFLLILNFIIISYGQNSVKSLVLPAKLRHGFVPAFPDHYFRSKSHISSPTNQSLKSVKVDRYLQHHAQKNSLINKVPPVLHVVWCEEKYFTFSNYLSVLSGFKVIQPSVIYLHLLGQPEMDPNGYYQFLSDLKRDVPSLVLSRLTHKEACSSDPVTLALAYLKILGPRGGIVINGQTLLSPSPDFDSVLSHKVSVMRQEESRAPLVVTAQSNLELEKISNEEDFQKFLHSKSLFDSFCAVSDTYSFQKKNTCVYITNDLFPVHVLGGESQFRQLMRWVGYGTSQKMESLPENFDIVPNIVHYVWLGQRSLNFMGYLSLLSSIHVLKADQVYIHGDYEPLGDYWKEVVKDKRVNFIKRDFPPSVYGEPIKKFASHASDYLRADILLRYGGIYADWDVLFVKPMWPSLRRHKTTANVDWPKTGVFPDVINLGVLIAAPGAPFLRHFLESYRWYLDNHWSYNAIHMPYKVYEKVPSSLNIDRHLQVSCAVGNCHATFLGGYKEADLDHLKSPSLSWRKDTLAFHWTHPDPEEFSDRESLLKSKSVPGEIGKFILQMASLA
ncbi:uncharacterized protein LOC101864351 [Aplysia californica]|uniref:Uncharacterized protein LOC101864351 n=1 Tax=Aplysia californica TaxID=6500 RepID=A0ABM0JBV5_APLCA|nr:uncharacterized protein LOC101864351 [Aplysia californica]